MSSAAAHPLDEIVTKFRRLHAHAVEADASAAVLMKSKYELEVRKKVPFAVFKNVYEKMLEKKTTKEFSPKLSQTVTIIMKRTARDADSRLQPQKLIQIDFVNGERKGTSYRTKKPMIPSVIVPETSAAPRYTVSLAEETVDEVAPAIQNGLVRVKSRTSFFERVGAFLWRVDMTVVRNLVDHSAAAVLQTVVTRMFRGDGAKKAITPANMLAVLGCGENDAYQYEIEEELMGAYGKSLDTLRAGDIAAVVAVMAAVINPDYVKDEAAHNILRHLATMLGEKNNWRLRGALSLKRLLPSVAGLTRASYREIYPPDGAVATVKADGTRGICAASADSFIVLTNVVHGEMSAEAFASANFVLDCEVVYDAGGKKIAVVYPIDVIVATTNVAGAGATTNVTSLGYLERIIHFESAAAAFARHGIPMRLKPYVHLIGTDPKQLQQQLLNVMPNDLRKIAQMAANEKTAVVGSGKKTETKTAEKKKTAAAAPQDVKAGVASKMERKVSEYDADLASIRSDGIIFTVPGAPYVSTKSYKWKPAELVTIDFLVRKCPPSLIGRSPYIAKPKHTLYLLFVGITPQDISEFGLIRCHGYENIFPEYSGRFAKREETAPVVSNYVPIQFSPPNAPNAFMFYQSDRKDANDLDGRIIEMLPEMKAESNGDILWTIVRDRTEERKKDMQNGRYFGNDIRSAMAAWINMIVPFPAHELWNGPTTDEYFQQTKDERYNAMTGFLSFIKGRRIGNLRSLPWVVDLGFGKGQDIFRYLHAGVRNLVAVDKDRAALAEAVRRRFEPQKKGFVTRSVTGAGTTFHMVLADIGGPFATTLERIRQTTNFKAADAVVCNLAIHYFLSTSEKMQNFVVLCRNLCRAGGTVSILCMFGEKVFETLRGVPTGSSWDITQDGAKKYSLRKHYTSNTLQPAGQRIGVLLPFSMGEYYDEYLVNTAALTAEFTARGFKLVSSEMASDKLTTFRFENPNMYNNLTADDKRYLGMFGELVYTFE